MRLTKIVNDVMPEIMKKANIKPKPSPPPYNKELGRRLRMDRVTAGLSLITLAAKLKITKGYLSRLESGKAMPSVQMVERIAKAVGADPDPLYILAGYLPIDVKQILYQNPEEAPTLLRDTFGDYNANQRSAHVMQPMEKSQPATQVTVQGKTKWQHLYKVVQADCFEWLDEYAPNSIHAIVTDPLVSHLVYMVMEKAGFEKRGEIIRLVQTLRGGDRPKNAHEEFADVTVMPRSAWEPWGLFRKPCEGRVQDNLRKWKTGGLRRVSEEQPFCDVIKSSPTRGIEREIAPHPSLKPQAYMRQIVRAALPLGEGLVLDPFMGGGSTIAAACAVGYHSIGIESDPEFYQMAVQAIPRLASLTVNGNGNGQSFETRQETAYQQSLFEH